MQIINLLETVGYHLLSDKSLKLINGAIMHSGVPQFLSDERSSILTRLAQKLLQTNEVFNNTNSVLNQLSKLPSKTILQSYQEIVENEFTHDSRLFSVNQLDTEFFKSDPIEQLRKKSLPDIPILLGSNSFEGRVLLNHKH